MACTALAVFQVIEIGRASSLAGSHALQQGNGDWVELSGDLLPQTLAGAELLENHVVAPKQKTSFRVYENTWTFNDRSLPKVQYVITVSQAWPGWHDAITDHLRDEWLLNDAQSSKGTIVDPAPMEDVPVVVADFHNTIAESGLIAFCQLDAFGQAFERPLTWSDIPDFLRRAASRAGNRIRPRIFVPDSILIQVEVHTIGDLPESVRTRALELLTAATEILRARIIDNQLPTGSVPTSDPPDGDAANPVEAAGRFSTREHLAQLIQK
jgi:hypothetical protein